MGMNNHGGKGSASRPLSVPLDEFGQKHDAIFGERKRTNGGWTPPPLPTDLGESNNCTKHMRETIANGGVNFGVDIHVAITDTPPTTEDGFKLTDVHGGNQVICKVHPDEK